jgi:hypothetical protein
VYKLLIFFTVYFILSADAFSLDSCTISYKTKQLTCFGDKSGCTSGGALGYIVAGTFSDYNWHTAYIGDSIKGDPYKKKISIRSNQNTCKNIARRVRNTICNLKDSGKTEIETVSRFNIYMRMVESGPVKSVSWKAIRNNGKVETGWVACDYDSSKSVIAFEPACKKFVEGYLTKKYIELGTCSGNKSSPNTNLTPKRTLRKKLFRRRK